MNAYLLTPIHPFGSAYQADVPSGCVSAYVIVAESEAAARALAQQYHGSESRVVLSGEDWIEDVGWLSPTNAKCVLIDTSHPHIVLRSMQ